MTAGVLCGQLGAEPLAKQMYFGTQGDTRSLSIVCCDGYGMRRLLTCTSRFSAMPPHPLPVFTEMQNDPSFLKPITWAAIQPEEFGGTLAPMRSRCAVRATCACSVLIMSSTRRHSQACCCREVTHRACVSTSGVLWCNAR